jgi:hypothetical protein
MAVERKGSEDEGLKDMHFAQSGENNKILKRLMFHIFVNENLAKYPVLCIWRNQVVICDAVYTVRGHVG